MVYKIWKHSITHYKVLNTMTNEVTILDKMYLQNVKFVVNKTKYNEAKLKDFKNSGNPFDFFAHMETNTILPYMNDLKNSVYYNPFKHHLFRDRKT